MHWIGLIHGDIKGSNILVSGTVHALLSDFGLSKTTSPQSNEIVYEVEIPAVDDGASQKTAATIRGAGSVRYQSPELFTGRSRMWSSDVYAFGITIAEVRFTLRSVWKWTAHHSLG